MARSNILWICTDQQRSDSLGCYDRTHPVQVLRRRAPARSAIGRVAEYIGAVLATGVETALEAFGDRARHETIVVYCAMGCCFSRLAIKLESRGYDSIFNLEGSLFKWANERRPMYRDTTCIEEVHTYDDEWGQLLAPRYRSEPD